jgi:hypothetical protein
MTRVAPALALASLAILPACGGGSTRRSITTPVVDDHTGTVYAFETDDRRGSADETIVIICNEQLTRVCYRVRPVDALSSEDQVALQEALRELRRRAEE